MEFGWIEGVQKNKAIIVPIKGKNQFLPENRIAFSWKDKKLPLNFVDAQKSITKQLKKAELIKKDFNLETIHSLLDDIREYSLDELSEYFLDDHENSIKKLGLFLSLREDSYWFKNNRNLTYTPRTEKELKLIKIQFFREKAVEEKSSNIKNWIKEIESGNWNKDSKISSEQKKFLEQLLDLLTERTESNYWKEISSIFLWGPSFGIAEENKIKSWLYQAGSPVSWSRLILLRAKVKDKFSKEIFDEVKLLQNKPLLKTKIIPKEIPTFTIDSEKTFDYDDAFSVFEWSKNGLKIAVHIADLSNDVLPKDLIFFEAESRISSVYTLEESYPMLPKDLSNEKYSLKAGEYRNVISFIFDLSSNGVWELINVDSRKIKVHKNLSYDEADHFIEEKKDFWDFLNKFCMKSKEIRIENGALNISRKGIDLDISDPKNICLTLTNRNSPANQIIEELAISVNSKAGKLFKNSDFPAIYRTQSSYEIVKKVENGVKLSMEHFRINPTRLTTIPDKHASLGCGVYIQVTSPIRRFSDLVMQIQLKKLIENKKPIFTKEDMMKWSEIISLRQKKYKSAELEILNYWKLKYVEQNLGENFLAKTKKRLSKGEMEICLLELDLSLIASGLVNQPSGEEILLKINDVNFTPPKLFVKPIKKNP